MHETACMAFSLLPFALVGRRIFPTTVDFCRPLPFPLLSSILSSSAVVGHERNAHWQARRLGCVLQIFIRRPAGPAAGTPMFILQQLAQ